MAMLALIMGISGLSLAAALTAQYVFGLAPCILCIYQRIPFIVAILLAALGFGLKKLRKDNMVAPVIGLSGLVFLANSVIAFYHSGVERHWWPSFLEGCAVPDLGNSPEDILKNIMNAPSVRCDEIPWADPILGLSMANYNVILCLGLAVVCFVSAILLMRKSV